MYAQQQPPPPQGYDVQHTGQTVVIQTSGLPSGPMNVAYNANPVSMSCPFCQAQIVTATSFVSGTFAFVICGILLILGFWLGCCLIPFCIDGCKDVVHTCPNCRQQLGRYNKM